MSSKLVFFLICFKYRADGQEIIETTAALGAEDRFKAKLNS